MEEYVAGKLLFESEKIKLYRRYAIAKVGIVIGLFLLYFIVMGIATNRGDLPPPCLLFQLLIFIPLLAVVSYISLKWAYPNYNIRIFENGVKFAYRIQSKRKKLPRSFYDARQYNWIFNHRYNVQYVTYNEIKELWFIKRDLKYYIGGYICIKEETGKWQLVLVPKDEEFFYAIELLQRQIGNKWNEVFTGVY
jgi:hypothetical protein